MPFGLFEWSNFKCLPAAPRLRASDLDLIVGNAPPTRLEAGGANR